jgi:polar amino acid transport system substrate-binding protein
MRPMFRPSSLIALAAAATALGACGSTSDRALHESLTALATPVAMPGPPSPTTPSTTQCGDLTASLRPTGPLPPPGRMPAGSFMQSIQRNGRLVAGVNQGYLLFGYLNPSDGRIEGFEVDLVRQVAKAIFGNRPNTLELKALTVTKRLPFVRDGSVDIVADEVTINCDRRKAASFSTVYYDAGQRVLVATNSPARGIGDLGGQRVCATKGSTPIDTLKREPSHPIAWGLPQGIDCLVALQQGTVAAISTDDSILLGFRAQDPYTKIVGSRLADEPYGMAIASRHPEFVRFVNAVLQRMRTDGTWEALARKWLGAVGAPSSSPTPHYSG